MNLLPDIYVLINAPQLILAIEEYIEATDCCLLIDIEGFTAEDIEDLYKYFAIKKTNLSFCFFCKKSESLEKFALNEYLSFFFLPSYKSVYLSPVLFVERNVSYYDSIINLFNQRLAKHRIGNACFVDYLEHRRLLTKGTGEISEELVNKYRTILHTLNRETPIYIIIDSADCVLISSIIKKCKEIECQFTGEDKMLLDTAYFIKQLKLRANGFRKVEDVLQKKNKVQEVIINLLKDNHPTAKLQQYYDQEYEVLPLWYKQLGHIIKAFMGKRTFRSLFGDKIKTNKS